MTKTETKQPKNNFVNTGRTAYKMKIPIINNPYSEQPYRLLWEKGWKAEQRKNFKRKR